MLTEGMASLKLSSHPNSRRRPGPVVLVVMDGVGIGREDRGDAVWLAKTPTLDRLGRGPTTSLAAHGLAVGMPNDNDMGNSEVGHNALGAGRVFDQGAKLVDESIASGRLFTGEVWSWLLEPCVGEAKALHFIGLLSDGNVHSHQDHLHALLVEAARAGCRRVYVHTLLDGRDVDSVSALRYIEQLESLLLSLRDGGAGDFRIASGGGRMVTTMDRYEADWSIVERGWAAHVLGSGQRFPSAAAAVETYRDENEGIGDQYLPAFVVGDESTGEPVAPIQDGDAVVLFNFRGDRALQISRAFLEGENWDAFDRVRRPDVRFAGIMQYDGDLLLPPRFLVDPPEIDRSLSEFLTEARVSQFACAETQKFGHVTYFWNGNRSGVFDSRLEKHLEIPGDLLPFEQAPWMKAPEVTNAVIAALRADSPPGLIRVNYANGDMVGHTGVLEATIEAVQAVDHCLARLLPEIERAGGAALITADHGNADQMFRLDGSGDYLAAPLTSHTLNRVPLYLFDPVGKAQLSGGPSAGLANVAATALELLGFDKPEDYAKSLLSRGPLSRDR